MDPRPYHFQYRRPRVNNPTYQSLKLYESIYQMDKYRRHNPENNITNRQSVPKAQSQQMRRHQSYDVVKVDKPSVNRYNKRQFDPKQNLNSSLSQYGNNIMNQQRYEQNRVFQKQQKAFDIINMHPKGYSPRLKNYPRLTLQDKLIQRNSSFDKKQ